MPAVTFDTLEFVKTLESAGMPVEQAEAISAAVRKAQVGADVTTRAEMATKADVAEVKAEVHELAVKMDALDSKFDMLKWLIGAVLVAVLAPLIKALF